MPACTCGGKPHLNKSHPCGCDKANKTRRAFKANLMEGSRHEQLEGKDHLVVPVIMIRSEVVMNEVLVPSNEILPFSWNGVPVTLYHPESGDGYTSANSPDILEAYGIGTIFNSRWDAGVLKGEAWIDVEKADALKPGLVSQLEEGEPMDVSTGFFSDDIDSTGTSNGRVFKRIARNLNPDHLALLPGGTGACSWEDGCGVRANERKDLKMADDAKDQGGEEKVSINAFTALLKSLGLGIPVKGELLSTNRRGDDDDYRQVVADLISNDATPFVPNDEDSLRMMSYETLLNVRNTYLPGDKSKDAEEEDVKANNKEADVADKDDKGYVTAAQVAEIVANALKEALPAALKANTVAPSLSDEDKLALEAAKGIVANAREQRITHLKANTDMTDDELKAFSDAQLETLANRIKAPVADYSGRGFNANVEHAAEGATDVAIEAMDSSVHVNEVLKRLQTNGKAN